MDSVFLKKEISTKEWVIMKIKNNPTECQQLELTEVDTRRNITCTDYENCLDVAVWHDWQGFNCLDCSQFESEVFMIPHDEIIEEIIDFLKEHELPQKNTVYDEANCAILVKESIKRLFRATNCSKKEVIAKRGFSRDDRDKIYNMFLAEWNGKGIVKHKKVTTRMKKAIDKVLKNADYPLAEVFKAFENYAEILYSPGHFWDYKWTMEDFLNRGLHKFVDEAQPFDNNKKEVKPASNNPYANFSCG